jgi:hypothetical protein
MLLLKQLASWAGAFDFPKLLPAGQTYGGVINAALIQLRHNHCDLLRNDFGSSLYFAAPCSSATLAGEHFCRIRI